MGVAIMVIAAGRIPGFAWDPGHLLLLLVMQASALGVVVAVFMAFAATGFWFEDRVGMVPPVYNLDPLGLAAIDFTTYGRRGLTVKKLNPVVAAAVDKALEDHELIKVKFVNSKEEKDDLARLAADKTGSVLVRVIGNVAIYYRHQSDPDRRVVHLPK